MERVGRWLGGLLATACALIALLALPQAALAEVTDRVVDDVFVSNFSGQNKNNYASSGSLIIGKGRHAYLRIDLEGLPTDGIESAQVNFAYHKGETKNTLVVSEASEFLTKDGVETAEPWDEANVTYDTRPVDVEGGWTTTHKADATLDLDVTEPVNAALAKGEKTLCLHITTEAVDDGVTGAVEYKRAPTLTILTGDEERPESVARTRSLTGTYTDDASVAQRIIRIKTPEGAYLSVDEDGTVGVTESAESATTFGLYMSDYTSYEGSDPSDLEWAKTFFSLKDMETGNYLTIQNYDEDGRPYYNNLDGSTSLDGSDVAVKATAPWLNWNERFDLAHYPESDTYVLSSHLNVYRDNLGYSTTVVRVRDGQLVAVRGDHSEYRLTFEDVAASDPLEPQASVSGYTATITWFAVNGDADVTHYAVDGATVTDLGDGRLQAVLTGLVPGEKDVTVSYLGDAPQTATVSVRVFDHPGVFLSTEQLDAMREHVANKEEPWYSDYQRLVNTVPNGMASADYEPQAMVATGRGDNTPAGHEIANFEQGGNAAYFNALLWVITGDDAYADAAARTLNAWSSTLQIVDGRDRILGAGINGYRYINAAEILRYYEGGYEGYSDEDFAQFQSMCLNVLYPVIEDLGAPMVANGNWDTGALITLIGIGVVCDDAEIYDRAIEMYQSPYVNGSIVNYVSDWGQSVEAMRDQAHAQLGVGYMADVCQIAEHQGDDLWDLYDNRLAKAFNWAAQYNLYGSEGDASFRAEPLEDLFGRTQWTTLDEQTINRGELRPVYEAPLAHYSSARVDVTWMEKAAEAMRPQGYVHNDNLNFGTLTTYDGEPAEDEAQPFFQMRTRLEPWYQRTWSAVEKYGDTQGHTVAETLDSYYAPDADGAVTASARRATAPYYQLETNGDGTYALRCLANNRYLSVTGDPYGDDGSVTVAFSADEVGENERFVFHSMGAGYYYLQSAADAYEGRMVKTVVEGSSEDPENATLRWVLSTVVPATTTDVANEYRFEAIYNTRDVALATVELPDVSELEGLVSQAGAISNDGGAYTPESFSALGEALAAARSGLADAADGRVSQDEVDALAAALRAAVAGLEPAGEKGPDPEPAPGPGPAPGSEPATKPSGDDHRGGSGSKGQPVPDTGDATASAIALAAMAAAGVGAVALARRVR